MMSGMGLFRSKRKFDAAMEEVAEEGRLLLRNIGWVSAGITVVALGVVIGRELRERYKFSHRTPYDAYAHSGDEMSDVEFGVGT